MVHIGYQLFYERINLFKGLCSEGNFYISEKTQVTLFDIIHVSKSFGVHIFPFPFETSIIQL